MTILDERFDAQAKFREDFGQMFVDAVQELATKAVNERLADGTQEEYDQDALWEYSLKKVFDTYLFQSPIYNRLLTRIAYLESRLGIDSPSEYDLLGELHQPLDGKLLRAVPVPGREDNLNPSGDEKPMSFVPPVADGKVVSIDVNRGKPI